MDQGDTINCDFKAINHILERIKVDGDHLIWTGNIKPDGRICFKCDNKVITIKRWIYETIFEEKIPPNHTCYSVCGNDLCVRSLHLDIKPLRQKKCMRGHWMSDKNTYTYTSKNGKIRKQCRKCKKMRRRMEYKRNRKSKK